MHFAGEDTELIELIISHVVGSLTIQFIDCFFDSKNIWNLELGKEVMWETKAGKKNDHISLLPTVH